MGEHHDMGHHDGALRDASGARRSRLSLLLLFSVVGDTYISKTHPTGPPMALFTKQLLAVALV